MYSAYSLFKENIFYFYHVNSYPYPDGVMEAEKLVEERIAEINVNGKEE